MSELFLVRDEAALRQCVGAAAGLAGDLVFAWPELASMSAQQARIIPPLKGEVGEQSEPGGVGCSNLDRQSNPTRPPVASLRRSTSPERGGTPRLLPRTIALAVCPAAFQGGAEERAVVAFSEAVRAWHLHGHRVVFLIFQKAGIVPGDAAMFEQIAARLGHDILVETRALIHSVTPRQFSPHIATSTCCVACVSMASFSPHCRAFRLSAWRTTTKSLRICRRFEMICLDAGGFDGSVLAHAVEAGLDRRPDPAVVELQHRRSEGEFPCACRLHSNEDHAATRSSLLSDLRRNRRLADALAPRRQNRSLARRGLRQLTLRLAVVPAVRQRLSHCCA